MYATYSDSKDIRVKSGVGVIVFDESGRILLERRSDNGRWGLPGGGIEPGESIEQTALREVYEETGLTVEIVELVGVYSSPEAGRIVTYPDNGDVRQLVDVVLTGKIVSGTLRLSEESLDLRFFATDSLPGDIVEPATLPIEDYLSGVTPRIR